MVDYGNPMPSATVPSPNAGVAASGRDQLWKLASDRCLPAAGAAVLVAGQLALTLVLLPRVRSAAGSGEVFRLLGNRLLGLGFLVLLAFLFVVRLPSRKGERRPHAVAVALLGSLSILAGSMAGSMLGPQVNALLQGPQGGGDSGMAAAIGGGLAASGTAFGLWSLLSLGRSFSVLPEARRLVTDGPYSFTRNPLYLGELVAGVGVLLPSFGVFQALVLAVFVACQLWRMRWEEEVLAHEFGSDFAGYRERVPRLLPRLSFHRGSRS